MQNYTSQHLGQLYELHSDTEVTFNAQVILESGLVTPDVRLTMGSRHLDCVLYACSMKGARIVLEVGPAEADDLIRSASAVALRLTFRQSGDPHPLSFFVTARIESLSEYNPVKPHVRIAFLEFTQRPPDALVAVLGSLLEIKSNAVRRRDQRIAITPEVMRLIGLDSRESCLAIDGTSRRCLLRDLSFGGAKVLLCTIGLPQSPQKVLLKLQRCDVPDDTLLDGNIVRVEDVLGHDDLVALSIKYTDPPLSYKQKINNLFTHP